MNEAAGLAAEVLRVAPRYRLLLTQQRFRGRSGGRRGHGVGSSLEFHDFRDYVPGDDLRHLDWRGLARTEQLRIRLHREEVSPFVDVLCDTSASMASTVGKARAVRLLLLALQRWAAREGATARCLGLGGGLLEPTTTAFAGAVDTPQLPLLPLRGGGVRVLVTDGLWPGEPAPFLQRVLANASRVACLCVLDPWELQPTLDGATTLVDVESGRRAEVQLEPRRIADYRQRLQRLLDAHRRTLVAGGASFTVVAARELATMCKDDLLPAGLLEPA